MSSSSRTRSFGPGANACMPNTVALQCVCKTPPCPFSEHKICHHGQSKSQNTDVDLRLAAAGVLGTHVLQKHVPGQLAVMITGARPPPNGRPRDLSPALSLRTPSAFKKVPVKPKFGPRSGARARRTPRHVRTPHMMDRSERPGH